MRKRTTQIKYALCMLLILAMLAGCFLRICRGCIGCRFLQSGGCGKRRGFKVGVEN